jgi:tetratricopeptide (TPR) repeat protein
MDPIARPPCLRVLDLVGVADGTGNVQPITGRPGDIVAILVAAGPAGLEAEMLADELWGEALPRTWQSSLRNFIARLRHELPGDQFDKDDKRQTHRRLELPPHDVDLWWLRELASQDSLPDDGCELILELAAATPFKGIGRSPVITRAVEELEVIRVELLQRLALERPELFTPVVVARLQAFAAEHQWDGPLAGVVESIAGGERRSPAPVVRSPDSSSEQRPLVSPRLSLARARLVGRDAAVDSIVSALRQFDQVGCEVLAPVGGGTTSLLAAIAAEMADLGHRTVCVTGFDGPRAPFGPLAQELPELSPIIDDFEGAGSQTDSARLSRCWRSMLAQLEAEPNPLIVVVDNARWLDDHTAGFLGFLAGVAGSRQLSVLVGGGEHDTPGAVSWEGLTATQLEALTEEDVTELIETVFPGRSLHLRRHLATEVMEITGGLAGHAAELVRTADPETLTLQGPLPSQSPMAGLDAVLGDHGRQVAAAAAVLGPEMSKADLLTVTDLARAEFEPGLAEVIGAGLLRNGSRPDRYHLIGSVRRAALTALVDRFHLGDMHFRAAPLATSNQLRAWHLESSDWRASEKEQAEAHRRAAIDLVEAGQFREAVTSFRTAERLLPESLSIDELISYATALDRSGVGGQRVRRIAMSKAQVDGDESLVLAAAISGLPEAELIDGDPKRIELLKSVRARRLTTADRVRHALAMSRQLLLAGFADQARRWADEAAAEGETVDDRAAAWLAVRHVESWVATEDYDGGFDDFDGITDLDLQTRVKQAEVVSSLIAGGLDRSDDLMRELKSLAARLGDPLRTWHAGLLECLILEEYGLFDAADRVGEATLNDGMLFGVAGAPAARAAQRTRRGWHLSQPGAYEGPGSPEAARLVTSLIARAGLAVKLFHGGRRAEGLVVAEDVHESSAGSRFEPAVAGLLATLARHCSPKVCEGIHKTLTKRAGTAMVVGAGVGSLGPVEGLLAHLEESADERLELRRRAVKLADSWDAPVWRIRTRAYLAAETNDRSWLDEAADIAGTTEFAVPDAWWNFDVRPLP